MGFYRFPSVHEMMQIIPMLGEFIAKHPARFCFLVLAFYFVLFALINFVRAAWKGDRSSTDGSPSRSALKSLWSGMATPAVITGAWFVGSLLFYLLGVTAADNQHDTNRCRYHSECEVAMTYGQTLVFILVWSQILVAFTAASTAVVGILWWPVRLMVWIALNIFYPVLQDIRGLITAVYRWARPKVPVRW